MEVVQLSSVYNTPSDVESKLDPEKGSPNVGEQDTSPSPEDTNSSRERRVVRRIDLRMIPLAMFVYLLCLLNRANMGNVQVLNSGAGNSLQQTIRISDQQYRVILVVFLVSYSVFETPSNYLLKKFAPSRWIPILMMGWGLMTVLLGIVHNFADFVALRFLLGMFEAGLFPGLVYCLTFWYKPNERALRFSSIAATSTLGGAFGGAIAFAVGHMDRVCGLEAWRWLFILEGLPSFLCALVVFLLFPDYPETDTWLSPEDRELVIKRLSGVSSLGHARITWADARATLVDWRLYLHYVMFIAISVPFSSISLFTPAIVTGLGYEGLQAQLFTVPPYAIAFVVTLLVAWVTDKCECRAWGAAFMMAVSGTGFLLQGILLSENFAVRYGLLCVSVTFSFASIPPLLSWLAANLRGTGALTLGIPLNVSIGQIGEVVGIFIYKTNQAPRYQTGHFTNAAFLLTGAVVALMLRILYVQRNKALSTGERPWLL